MPKTFWCEDCQDWTPEGDAWDDGNVPGCGRCGEPYRCGWCGYDVDRSGKCQREAVTGEPCGDPEESKAD